MEIPPQLLLSTSRAFTFTLILLSALIPLAYSILFRFHHPLFLLPTTTLILIFLLELFEIFDFSPLIILIKTYVSWKRIQIETQIPYAMLFLNQTLSLGVPLESALDEMEKQLHIQELVSEIKNPKISSDYAGEFINFIEQCRRVGVTPQILDDLLIMSNTQKNLALSRFRSMSNLAGQIFTYSLTLYTASILFIIVTAINSGSIGLEFFLLDLINPLLFFLGFTYLIKEGAA
jgi:hypothetical protein